MKIKMLVLSLAILVFGPLYGLLVGLSH